MPYVVNFDSSGTATSIRRVSDSYLIKYKDDLSNPATNPEAVIMDNSGINNITKIHKIEKPKINKQYLLDSLGLTEQDLQKIKGL